MALIVVPNAGQTLAVTRDPIRNNFGTINAAFLVDHVEYNLADQGKHKQVTFPNNAAPAAPIGNEIKLYNATSGGAAQIFVQRVAAPAINIPFTESNRIANGYAYLASGIILKWGTGVADNGAGVPLNIDVTSGGTAYTTLFQVFVTPFGGVADTYSITTAVTAPSNLRVYSRLGTTGAVAAAQYRYLAIGI